MIHTSPKWFFGLVLVAALAGCSDPADPLDSGMEDASADSATGDGSFDSSVGDGGDPDGGDPDGGDPDGGDLDGGDSDGGDLDGGDSDGGDLDGGDSDGGDPDGGAADSGGMDGGGTDGGAADGGGGTDGGGTDAGTDATMPECVVATDCDDGFTCTVDSCDAGSCVNRAVDIGCGDGLYCNGVEACAPGSASADATTGCAAGPAPDCNDGVSCTTDACDETTDTCANVVSDALCDDMTFCTGVEVCAPADAAADATTGCVAGTTPACDDGTACTVDSCNMAADACANTASNALCDNALFCDGTETCAPTNPGADAAGCVAGTSVLCDDTFACTDDVCDEVADSCISTPVHTSCDDGAYCNGTEACDPAAGGADAAGCAAGTAIACMDDGFSCTDESCNEVTDACDTATNHMSCGAGMVCTAAGGTAPTGCVTGSTCTVDLDCDDGDMCNGAETCGTGGICQGGTALACDDGVACTGDTCDAVMGCLHVPDDSICDNGLFCDGTESCDAVMDCQAGVVLTCDDLVSCTLDSCSEAAGGCLNTIDDSACDNGVFCDGVELCSPTSDCQVGTPPTCEDTFTCTDDSCDGATDACLFVPVNSRCDDGAYCNGTESCAVGAGCQSGSAILCNDGIACSDDACNETSDMCEAIFNSMNCASGDVCTAVGCTPGSACTGPTASLCDDGLFCNGIETCSSVDSTPGVCQAGSAPSCNDSNACTIDSCSDSEGRCTFTPRDVDMDGFGDSICGGLDCNDGDPAINPTATDICDGVDNDCDTVIDGGLGGPGDLCSAGPQCCTGSCASGICVDDTASCMRILDTCTADSECCTGLCSASIDGALRCQVPGGCGVGGTACLTSADCCSGGCVGGFCDDMSTCADTGASCTMDVECCTHNCNGGTCDSAGSGCNVDGEACSSAGNCCSGFCFEYTLPGGGSAGRCSGHDTCRGEGQICSTNGDCCNGGCDFAEHPATGTGRCQETGSCSTAGESCTSVRGCCSALCVDAGSGVGICEFLPGCQPFGEICSMNGDCCSDECGPPDGTAGLRRCVNPPGCVDAGEICAQGGSNNCCVLKSRGCTPTGLGVSRCNDQAMCIMEGDQCDFSEQCCPDATGDPVSCILDASGVRRCSTVCIPAGMGTCTSNGDCCEGRCLDGICDDTPIGCIPFGGGGCVLDGDCCSGSCLGGLCGIGD